MKIEANVKFNVPVVDVPDGNVVKVDVDTDYVTPCESDVYEYVANELAEMFGRSFGDDEFTITNIIDVLDDLRCEDA